MIDLFCSSWAHSLSNLTPWTECSILLMEMSSKLPGFMNWWARCLNLNMAKASHSYGDPKWSAIPLFSVAALCVLLVEQWCWDPWLIQGWEEKWRIVTNREIWTPNLREWESQIQKLLQLFYPCWRLWSILSIAELCEWLSKPGLSVTPLFLDDDTWIDVNGFVNDSIGVVRYLVWCHHIVRLYPVALVA